MTAASQLAGSAADRILADLGGPGRGVVVDSPPGAGKSTLVVRATQRLADAGESVMVIAQTNEQVDDLIYRLAESRPGLAVGRLSAGDYAPTERVAKATVATKAADLADCTVILGTAHKWATAGADAARPWAAVDEAYQMRSDLLLRVARLFDHGLFVGDPGQLDPFSTVDTERWAGLSWDPMQSAVAVLLRHNPDIPVHTLPVSWRLPAAAAPVVSEAFYPFTGFRAATSEEERALTWNTSSFCMNDVDLSLETAARSGWALHELPARHTVRTDREVAVACATLAARLLQRGAVARSERGEAPVTASRIAVGTAHRDQSQAVRAILRDEGITGVTVDTANSLQGREFDVTIVWHPLSSRRDATAFHLESGRLCVLVSRHRHACIVVARAGIPELLDAHPSAEPVYLNVPVKFPDGWEAHQALMAHLAGVRELVLAKIQHFELSPEMSPDSDGGHRAECACGLAWRRVDKSDWRAFASLLDRESQVGVVGDHQSGIDMVTEYIQEQVRRNVDVAAFLLAMGDRNHEACVADSRAHPVLDHNRPLGGDQSRTAVGFAHRQWGGFDTRDVVAELDVIDASGQSARSPMSVAAKPRMSSHRQPGVPRPHVERPP